MVWHKERGRGQTESRLRSSAHARNLTGRRPLSVRTCGHSFSRRSAGDDVGHAVRTLVRRPSGRSPRWRRQAEPREAGPGPSQVGEGALNGTLKCGRTRVSGGPEAGTALWWPGGTVDSPAVIDAFTEQETRAERGGYRNGGWFVCRHQKHISVGNQTCAQRGFILDSRILTEGVSSLYVPKSPF